jgi:RNAse (barnase) inhibitor barstar
MMEPLAPSRSGVYRIAHVGRIDKLALATIRFQDRENLLRAIAAALRFPDWFGQNWDALEDCLTDLSWLPADGYVLVFEQAQPGDEFGVLVDVLRSSAEHWAGRGKPFFALFVDPARRLPLPELGDEK